MKQIKISFLLTALLSMVGTRALAWDAKINGIYYNFSGTEATVTRSQPSINNKNAYTGSVIIPKSVTYNGKAYSVTSIGSGAFEECSGLTSVTIPNSVTSIGGGAFYACRLLRSVTIPNSVTKIGGGAFENCSGLTSVTIPNSVTTINSSTFKCSGLTNITIPNSVTTIGEEAFYYCRSLKSVTIGNSVTSIGKSAFIGCGLQKVIVKDIAAWCGIEFKNSSSNPLCYAKQLYSDENTEITNLHIPDGVTRIGDYAFRNCSGLTSVTIPSSVNTIGEDAFFVCEGIQKVIVKNIAAWYGILFANLYSNPLYYAKHLYSDENTEITNLVIPDGVTTIRGYAFYNCSCLTSITIPNSVTSIGSNAFSYCTGILTINCNIPNGSSSGSPFMSSSFSEIIIGNDVTSIGNYAFSKNFKLTSVTIPNSVTSIGSNAFYNCSGLTSVTIPNSVTTIGSQAFSSCSNLKSATIGAGVLDIGSGIFSGNQPTKVIWLTNTPPKGYSNAAGTVNYVANNLYTSLSNKTVYPFLSSIFEVDGVKYVPVSPAERTCDAIDCTYDSNVENVNIGKTASYKGIEMAVQRVHKYAFYQNQNLKNVNLSLNGDVEDYAFYGCKNISQVTAVNGGNIGASVFEAITSEYVANINNNGSIRQKAFYQSTGLKTLEIGGNVTNVGSEAFSGCTNLTTAQIQNKGNLGEKAFQNCTAMTTATLGEAVTGIGNYAFDGCSSLESVVIPNAVTNLGDYAFQNCKKMISAKMGMGVEAISQYAFSGCSSLTDMQIGINVKTINRSAFSGCSALPKIQIPQNVTAINNNVFERCSSLKTVIMDDGQEAELKLGSNGSSPLFSSCPLDTVYIGRNISYSTSSSYGYSPFYRNTSLRSVHITDKETEISPNEFYGCTNLKNVRIGDGVTTIGDWAFSGCSSIDFFSFGSSVKTIGKEAFSDCTAMTKLISRATTPPSCGSQALDDINKWNCTLSVPKGYASAYQQAAQWKEFFFINDDATTAIKPISDNAVEIIENYDLNGTRQNRLQKGVNIVRMSDGTVKKVIVK